MLGSIQKYLMIAGAAIIGVMAVALKILSAQKTAARAEATRQKVRAKGEEVARKHVTNTVEKTREVKDSNRERTADERRNRLRNEYASRPRDTD